MEEAAHMEATVEEAAHMVGATVAEAAVAATGAAVVATGPRSRQRPPRPRALLTTRARTLLFNHLFVLK